MRYQKLYNKIIKNAQSHNRSKKDKTYYESHHIKPKSLGGTNDASNLVLLTAKEHFVCHHLLIKFTKGDNKKRMVHAFWGMCNQLKGNNQRDYKITSSVYEHTKTENARNISESMQGENSHRWGKNHSEETKNKN